MRAGLSIALSGMKDRNSPLVSAGGMFYIKKEAPKDFLLLV